MTPIDPLDGEPPRLVRPFVRLMEREPAEPSSDRAEPSSDGADPSPAGPDERARRAADPRPAGADHGADAGGHPRTRRVRGRRHRLAVTFTVVALLGITALVLGAADLGDGPAPGRAQAAGPNRGGVATATLTAPSAAATTSASEPSPSEPPAEPAGTWAAKPAGTPAAQPAATPAAGPVKTPAAATPSSGPPGATASPVPSSSPPPGDRVRTGTITRPSGLCLDGARLRAWTCDGSVGQTWTVRPDGSVQTLGRCLDGASRPVLRDCDGTPAQQWRAGTAGTLINAGAGLCLSPADDEDGRAPLRMTTCGRAGAQRWSLP
ncbi:RICIN domain-containing protein [Dactylosporangium sp. NPDC000555]|uniref:RICIN domain-containing protein n=1 Tax=Dactylosporangium sp. NPDC000555 TaxID=3154260 RepID=UPI00331DC517